MLLHWRTSQATLVAGVLAGQAPCPKRHPPDPPPCASPAVIRAAFSNLLLQTSKPAGSAGLRGGVLLQTWWPAGVLLRAVRLTECSAALVCCSMLSGVADPLVHSGRPLPALLLPTQCSALLVRGVGGVKGPWGQGVVGLAALSIYRLELHLSSSTGYLICSSFLLLPSCCSPPAAAAPVK